MTAHAISVRARIGITVASLFAVGGLGTLGIAGATGALAQTPATGSTNATATVAAATSLTDNTPNISFPAGGGSAVAGNTYPTTVSLSEVDNAGPATVSAEVIGTGLNGSLGIDGTHYIPYGAMSDNGVAVVSQGSSSTCVPQSAGGCGIANPVDSFSNPGVNAITDNWSLAVPAAQAPGTYTGVIYYELNG